MQKKPTDALLFIDTNILLDFYRVQGGGGGLELLNLIEEHNEILLTGSQVEMEFKKNRQGTMLQSLKGNKLPDMSTTQAPAFLVDSKQNKALETSGKSFKTNHQKLKQRIERVIANPIRYDPVYKVLQRIFKKKSAYNLDRSNELRFEIRDLAKKRFILGYPPRKATDTSIGDAINWEWIIYAASKYKKNVVIVTRDTDYGNYPYVNDWLRQEFKARVSSKKDIYLTDMLSKAFKMISIPVSKEAEKDESDLVAIKNAIENSAANPLNLVREQLLKELLS